MSSDTSQGANPSAETASPATAEDGATTEDPQGGNIFDDIGNTVGKIGDALGLKPPQRPKTPQEIADEFDGQHHGRVEGSDEQNEPPAAT
jgi:hypothetical protein